MRHLLLLILIGISSTAGANCAPYLTAPNARVGTALTPDLGQSNAVYSRANVLDALRLLWPATAGEARKNLAELLGLPEDLDQARLASHWERPAAKPGGTRLRRSASLWSNSGRGFLLNDDYAGLVRAALGAQVEALDFATPEALPRLNGYVDDATDHLIQNLLPRLDAGADLVVITTLFIEGRWAAPFNPRATREEPFTKDDGTSTPAAMMRTTRYFEYGHRDGFRVVRMFSADQRAAVEFALPDRAGPEARAQYLEGATISLGAEQMVDLSLPRFRISWTGDVTPALRRLSPSLFVPGALAGLGSPGQQISEAIHAADLGVHEFGFKGAAATAISTTRGIGPTPDVTLKLDRPFGVRVLDFRTSEELFRGWVSDPGRPPAP